MLTTYLDLPAATYFFPFPATAVADGIINLHNHIFYTSVLILIFIFYIVGWIIFEFNFTVSAENRDLRRENFLLLREFKHDTELEIAWTMLPCLILLLIAIPSFSFLYIVERVPFVSIFFKAIGHQWYWSYELGPYEAYFFFPTKGGKPLLINKVYDLYQARIKADVSKVEADIRSFFGKSSNVDSLGYVKKASIHYFCDSYMIDDLELNEGETRLLTVDVPLVLPYGVFVGLLTSSVDVIHSFAVPEFGLKLDAIPGRINQFSFLINKSGIFYGQCSELCGVGHAFMPISVYAIDKATFFDTMQDLVNTGSYSSKVYYDFTHQKMSKLAAVNELFYDEDKALSQEFKDFVPAKSLLGVYKSPIDINFKF